MKNRAALALRRAANGLHRSQSALGEFYRRMRAKLGAPKAITATAHKLSRILFHLLTTRQSYDETVFAEQERRYRQRAETRLIPSVSISFPSVIDEPRKKFLGS